ncbi:transmembrane protein 72 isoform X1 [Sardina pilchardus]|uniref:transmembrane protein 72 isoform X1 n=1 Tax=Sardina pilchardus TaxID=27697 RepID=UPI002E115500
MGVEGLWLIVECACRIMGISTAAVLCGVGVETLRQGEYHSLAVYLLVCSGGMMVFEMAFFIDAMLEACLPCPPGWKVFVLWKKMARVGGFQKFLYYTMMSVVCFLHPVLLWHVIIPGTMLLVTGFLNFTLSKRKKAEPPKLESRDAYRDPSLADVQVTEGGATEHTFSFFNVLTGGHPSSLAFLPSNSRLQAPHGASAALQGCARPPRQKRRTGKGQGCFGGPPEDSSQETEMEEYPYMDSEETTSDKAPMIPP